MRTDRDSQQENVEAVASREDRAKQGTVRRLDNLGRSDLRKQHKTNDATNSDSTDGLVDLQSVNKNQQINNLSR
jgi:hypothetical protein